MTLDDNGQFSTDKTNSYRALVDMAALPAGQTPATYCADMENVQGTRLQQDVNLLLKGQSPAPGAADSLFTFLAMRLQQSFTNLNCGQFGLTNNVSTTVDGNGVVVAACFAHQVRAITAGAGNPMAGQTACPASQGGPSPTASASQGSGQPTSPATAAPSPSVTPSMNPSQRTWYHHHHHG
jgi:hypothetical protein